MRNALIVLLLFCAGAVSGQNQKLKGSKNVTVQARETGDFENIEVEDNIEVFLSMGDQTEIEIEADDNLHEALSTSVSGGTLYISASADVTGAKKFSVRVTYTANLRMIVAKDDTRITGLTDIDLANFTLKTSGNAKVYTNVKSKTFTLMANDKSKIEMNLTAEKATVELSKNASLKALISSPQLRVDMYQKSSAAIEGDVNEMKLRIDNNAEFVGKNLTARNAEILAEGSSSGSLGVTGNAIIEASGKSSIDLHGDQQKIEIRKFIDQASIRKRPVKA